MNQADKPIVLAELLPEDGNQLGLRPPRSRAIWWILIPVILVSVIVLVASVAYWARMERARRQHEAVEAMKSMGGYVVYDWELEPSRNGVHNA